MIVFQKMIFREDLRRNPEVLYVFGDNVARRGFGGQARHMRGEPNAVGVATKYSPVSYFAEAADTVANQNRIIDNDMKVLFEHLHGGGVVIWPADGIGTGLADLKNKAPSTFMYLETKIAALVRLANVQARA